MLVLAAVIVIGAALSAAYFMVLRRPYAVLYANLRSADAATIVAELDKRKTPYRLAQGGATILAPQGQIDGTRLTISNEDLPLKGAVGFELFNKSDMGLTEFAQKINYQRALQGELARTIMTIDAVDSARVHLSIADPTLFRDDRRPSKASITLTLRPGKSLSHEAVLGIQRLVASAVPDLAADDVVVLDESGATISGAAAPAPAEDSSPQAQERHAVEQYYISKIRKALTATPGASDAQVTVTALTEPSVSSIEGRAAALEAWTPTTRGFPLAVTLSLPVLPDATARSQIQKLVGDAAGLDPKKGDSVALGQGPGWEVPPAEPAGQYVTIGPAAAAAPVESSPSGPSATTFWEMHLIPLLLVLVGAAFLLHRFSGRRLKLTLKQRESYVRRLRSFLHEGPEHAA